MALSHPKFKEYTENEEEEPKSPGKAELQIMKNHKNVHKCNNLVINQNIRINPYLNGKLDIKIPKGECEGIFKEVFDDENNRI